MFLPVRFKTSVQIAPGDLNDNFDETIKAKLKDTLEGVCSRYGYIKPGSLEIIKRSAGLFTKQHFNGHLRFEIQCRGDVCNPAQGLVVQAVVKNKNAMGLLAESSIEIANNTVPILDIIIPKKSNGIMSEIDLEEVQIGDHIYVMVMGKRYQLNDTSISIIGRAVKKPKPKKGKEDIAAEADAAELGTDQILPEVQPGDDIDGMYEEDDEEDIPDNEDNEDEDHEVDKEKDEDDEDVVEEDEIYDEDDIDDGDDDLSDIGDDY